MIISIDLKKLFDKIQHLFMGKKKKTKTKTNSQQTSNRSEFP